MSEKKETIEEEWIRLEVELKSNRRKKDYVSSLLTLLLSSGQIDEAMEIEQVNIMQKSVNAVSVMIDEAEARQTFLEKFILRSPTPSTSSGNGSTRLDTNH